MKGQAKILTPKEKRFEDEKTRYLELRRKNKKNNKFW